jgi:GNAT superfamily N-acetyltransferase
MAVRRAAQADKSAVIELLAAQLAEHEIALDAPALDRAVDGVLAEPSRGFFLVAHDGDATVGVAYVSLVWSLEHGGRAAWLEELYVRPAQRNTGTGTQMLELALAEARAAGCAAMDLEVQSDHARAARLYARHGFTAHQRERWFLKL